MFSLMKRIGQELNANTEVFTLSNPSATAMDLCMAPGGYTATVQTINPQSHVDCFSLHIAQGGHKVMHKQPAARMNIHVADITMYATELGTVSQIPLDHPERAALHNAVWPHEQTKTYDLVICDGHVLRFHLVPDYRQSGGNEASRLMNSQLILALTKVNPGGKILILSHKLATPVNFNLIRMLASFADVRLYKPRSAHRERSSFYIVVTNVQPHCTEARHAVEIFREAWVEATLPERQGHGSMHSVSSHDLEAFGPRFIELGRKVWKVQADALETACWMKQ